MTSVPFSVATRLRSLSRWAWMVILGTIAYAAIFSTLNIMQHYGFRSTMVGLGNAVQAIWMASQGDWTMPVSNDASGVILSRLAVHVNLFFLPIALLYRVLPYPELLLILTATASALAGAGAYMFARAKLGDGAWAILPAFAFWTSPIVHDATLWDFHIITLYTAFLVWAVWAFDTGRIRTAWILIVCAWTCKEDASLITAVLGVAYLVRGHRRRGAALIVLSLAYLLTVMNFLAPAVNDGAGLVKLEGAGTRYAWLGDGVLGKLRGIAAHPLMVLHHMSQPDHSRIVVYLLLCGGLAARGGGWLLLPTVTPLVGGLLAYRPNMTHITGTYYWIACEAFIVLACIDATRRRRARAATDETPHRPPAWTTHWPLMYLLTASVVLSFLVSPAPHSLVGAWEHFAPRPERAALDDIIAAIPPDASVSAQSNIGPHLMHRRDIATFPRRLQSAEYALVFLRDVGGPANGYSPRTGAWFQFHMPPRRIVRMARRLIMQKRWALVRAHDGFFLFRRAGESPWSRGEALQKLRPAMRELVVPMGIRRYLPSETTTYLNGEWKWKSIFAPMEDRELDFD